MKQWPSIHRPAVVTPWNPCWITPYPSIPSNPRRCLIQTWSEYAWRVKCLGEWQDRGSKRLIEPNIRVSSAKSKPHTARWLRCVITENLGEMGMDIVPRINKRSALTIWGKWCFFLIGMVRFGINNPFAYIKCGGRIRDNLFSLTMGRALTFRWRHGTAVDRGK